MAVQIAEDQIVREQIARKQFTVADYARMHEAGIFAEDDCVELLDGDVYTMSSIIPVHAAIVNRLTAALSRNVGEGAIVSVQNPIQLGDLSEPLPDVALLRPRDDFYAAALPIAADVLLVIEVADTSLGYDRDEKLPRYAAAGIPEVWIVDVARAQIEQHTEPRSNLYRLKRIVAHGEAVTAHGVAGVQLDVNWLFN